MLRKKFLGSTGMSKADEAFVLGTAEGVTKEEAQRESLYLTIAHEKGHKHLALIDASTLSPFDLATPEHAADRLLLRFAREARLPPNKDGSNSIHDRATALIRGSTNEDIRYIAMLARQEAYSQEEFLEDVREVGRALRDLGVSPAFPDIKPMRVRHEHNEYHLDETKLSARAKLSANAGLGLTGDLDESLQPTDGESAYSYNVGAGTKGEVEGKAEKVWKNGTEHQASYEQDLYLPGDAGTVLGIFELSRALGLPSPTELRKECGSTVVEALMERGEVEDFRAEIKATEIMLTRVADNLLRHLDPPPRHLDSIRERLEQGHVAEAAELLSKEVEHDHSQKEHTPGTLAFTVLALATYYKGTAREMNRAVAANGQVFIEQTPADLTVSADAAYQPREGDRPFTAQDEGLTLTEKRLAKMLQVDSSSAAFIRRGNEVLITDAFNPRTQAFETSYTARESGKEAVRTMTPAEANSEEGQHYQRLAVGAPAEMPIYIAGKERYAEMLYDWHGTHPRDEIRPMVEQRRRAEARYQQGMPIEGPSPTIH